MQGACSGCALVFGYMAIVSKKQRLKKKNAGRLQRLRSGVWLDGNRLKEAIVELVSRQQGDGGGAIFFF
jgi:hypothetical protein